MGSAAPICSTDNQHVRQVYQPFLKAQDQFGKILLAHIKTAFLVVFVGSSIHICVKGYKNFYSLNRFLRKKLPFERRYYIRRIRMPKDLDGDCGFNRAKSTFLVRIEKSLSENAAIETLLHEVAHCLAWDKDKEDHGPNWGKAYSIVYRKFLEWNE